jgi:hypothetical protein
MPTLPTSLFSRAGLSRAGLAAGVLAGTVGAVVAGPIAARAATPVGVPLPISSSFGDMLVDGLHQRIFLSDPGSAKVVAVGYDGKLLGTVSNLSGVQGLALSADETQLYAAAPNADVIAAIDPATVTETARYTTGTDTDPTYLAVAGGKIWFGYGPDAHGGLGSLDLSGDSPVVSLDQDPGGDWYGPPMLATTAASSGMVAAGDPETSSGQLKIFDVSGGSAVTTAEKRVGNGIMRDLSLSADGSRLLTVEGGSIVTSWQTSDLTPSTSYPVTDWANSVAMAPDGRVAVSTTNYPVGVAPVHVFLPGASTPVRDFPLPHTFNGYQDDVIDGGLAWEPGGDRLFVISSAYPDSHQLVVLTETTMSEPALTVSVPATAARAKPVKVSGAITASLPLAAGTPVTVTRIDAESPSGKDLGAKAIDANGRFSFTDTPAAGGKITYRISYAGDSTHLSATKSGTVTVPSDASGLTLNHNKGIYAYATKVTFTAHLGKAYKNKTVELWSDPAGTDKANVLVKKATADSKGNVAVALTLTRNTTVSAIYRGDTRTAAKTVRSTVYAKVKVSMAVTKHYKTKKIGSTSYYVFHKKTDPLFTTTMTAAKGRSQQLSLQYYYEGAWRSGQTDYFLLSSKGKSAVTLTGTHDTNLRMRMRSSYSRGTDASGDTINYTTVGAWKYFIFTS